MQCFLQWHVNFDGLCFSGGRCLVIFSWFSPFLHFSLTHSRPLRVDWQTHAQICRGSAMQKPSTSLSPCHGWQEADGSDPRALHRQAYWTWQHHLCPGRWLTWAEAVESAPTCWATFFIANTGCSTNTHVSILSHCLQVQTNNSGRMEICYQPALSQHSQKQKLYYWRGSEWTIALNTLKRYYYLPQTSHFLRGRQISGTFSSRLEE